MRPRCSAAPHGRSRRVVGGGAATGKSSFCRESHESRTRNSFCPDGLARPCISWLMSTGRNDSCPCGSGKKYKTCHGIADLGAVSRDVSRAAALKACDTELGGRLMRFVRIRHGPHGMHDALESEGWGSCPTPRCRSPFTAKPLQRTPMR
ncbi:MAG: SEC-C metal-binding domain-containing protein [Gemmatimonadaceae bacterium]